MNKEEMIDVLNQDLRNEWMHLRFYLHHASMVTGLHCHEYKELFLKEAASEMEHVTQFSDLIIGLGGIPTTVSNEFPFFTDPRDIIEYAVYMESLVVSNYALRIKEAADIGGVDGQWLEIFLEKQIEHSREDVDHFKQILRGI
jgi:bacterioferritin (cytochrome b1)